MGTFEPGEIAERIDLREVARWRALPKNILNPK